MTTQSSFDLSDRTIIVTGASSGMGAAIAVAVAHAGGSVVAVGRSEARLGATRQAIEAEGAAAEIVAVDLVSEGAPDRIVRAALDRFGGVHGVVHTAGIVVHASLEATEREQFDLVWRTNVLAPYLLTQRAMPHLLESRGSVVFVSSIAGTAGLPDLSAYSASKGAINQLTKSLAMEYARQGVRVNCLAPGSFLTPMNDELLRDPAEFEKYKELSPLGRWAEAHEIGPAAVFLLSEASSFVIGAVVPVDGGFVAR